MKVLSMFPGTWTMLALIMRDKSGYIWRVQMQKPLSAVWNFLLKLAFFSGFYVYVQLFHFNVNENNLCIAIKVKLKKPTHIREPDHFFVLILELHFKWHLEELFICLHRSASNEDIHSHDAHVCATLSYCNRGGSRTASSAPPEGSISRILIFPCWTQIPIMPLTWDWLHTTPAPHLHTHTHIKATRTHHISAKSWIAPAVITERCYPCLHYYLLVLDCYPISDCSPPAQISIVSWTLTLSACLDSLDSVSIALFTGLYYS